MDDGRLFVEGDNPDPTSSNDSHNFGLLKLICNRCSSLAGLTGFEPATDGLRVRRST